MASDGERIAQNPDEEHSAGNRQPIPNQKAQVTGLESVPVDIPKPIYTAPQKPDTNQHPTEAERELNKFERSTIRLARLAFAASVLAAIFVGLQWYEMHTGSVDTKALAEAAGKQADAAGKQADRMKDLAEQAVVQAAASKRLAQTSVDTLNNTRKSFQDEQRAWVGVQDAIGSDFSESKPWKVRITFLNSGRTTARHIESSGMYITSAVPLTGPSLDQIQQLIFSPVQSVAPQGRYQLIIGFSPPAHAVSDAQRHGSDIMESQGKAIQDGKLFLYYYGILKYDDGFGRKRETQFCVLLASAATSEVGFCDAFNDLN